MSPNVLPTEASTDTPTAISFREFRDEEIVDFFANGQRTFQSPTALAGGFGRQRIVGFAHQPSEQKPTAAFRAAHVGKMRGNDPPVRRESSVLCNFRAPTIPLPTGTGESAPPSHPFGKQTRSLAAIARGNRKLSPGAGRAAKVLFDPLATPNTGPKESAPCPAGIRIDDGFDNPGEKPPMKSDDELTKIVERWPRLSSAVRETIGTLVEAIR